MRRDRVLAEADGVEFDRADLAVVGDGGVVDADAARAQDLRHELAQLDGAAVDPGLAGRLAEIAVGFERRDDGVDVAGGERALVFGDGARGERGRIARQQRRADAVMALERPER